MRKFEPAMLPLTAAMASALVGCSPSADVAERDLAICRDGSGRRVADSGCGSGHGGMGGAGFYYLARGSRVPAVGEPVSGGSGTPVRGVSYARASAATVTRGGFGASAEGGEGGGHGGGAGE